MPIVAPAPLEGRRGVELPGNRSASLLQERNSLDRPAAFLRQPSLCDSGGGCGRGPHCRPAAVTEECRPAPGPVLGTGLESPATRTRGPSGSRGSRSVLPPQGQGRPRVSDPRAQAVSSSPPVLLLPRAFYRVARGWGTEGQTRAFGHESLKGNGHNSQSLVRKQRVKMEAEGTESAH